MALTSNMGSTGSPTPRQYAAPIRPDIKVAQYAEPSKGNDHFDRNAYVATMVQVINDGKPIELAVSGKSLCINWVSFDDASPAYSGSPTAISVAFNDSPCWISVMPGASASGSNTSAVMIQGISFYKLRFKNSSGFAAVFQIIAFENENGNINITSG